VVALSAGRPRLPRLARQVRSRAPGRVRRLPGQDPRHRTGPGGHPPGLVPLRRVRAGVCGPATPSWGWPG